MQIVNDIQDILKQARQNVARVVNTTMVQAYWLIGKRIIEEDQQGETRAVYGKALLKTLSENLQAEFGTGFSVDNLQNMRLFYLTYPIYETLSRISNQDNLSISQTVSAKLDTSKSETASRISQTPQFNLTWSHYLILLAIKDNNERKYN